MGPRNTGRKLGPCLVSVKELTYVGSVGCPRDREGFMVSRWAAGIAAVLITLGGIAGCSIIKPTSTSPPSSTMSGGQRQTLDDWRIRAGLYEANDQPSGLAYVPDAGLGYLSNQCRGQLETLTAYRPGLLKAPDGQLAAAANSFDVAVKDLLLACERNDAVSLHHARGAIGVAISAVNVRYARLLGQDPSAYNSTKVL
jgi:hypothetical protein